MELCERLRQIRKDNNMTQQELADELCLSRTVITKFEKGYKVPNLNTLLLISNYFNTNIFDDYKNKFKLFILSLKSSIIYIISIMILIISMIILTMNLININNQYGYNIYNDELKVKNSDEICIVKYEHEDNNRRNKFRLINAIYSDVNNITALYLDIDINISFEQYSLVFINLNKNEKSNIVQYNNDILIERKPFIYPLKEYDESLPYNKQTGECKKILDYYIELIEKVK